MCSVGLRARLLGSGLNFVSLSDSVLFEINNMTQKKGPKAG